MRAHGEARWAAVPAGMGLLVHRITLPAQAEWTADALLGDRGAFEPRARPDSAL